MASPTIARYWKRTRSSLIAFGLLLLGLVAIFGATQIDQIREYFSQASGEPANIIVDTQGIIGPLERPWRSLAQGGESHDWQIQPVVPQVRALKPNYIRIDHIYDFYDIAKGSPGNLTFDFSKLDPILDGIEATGATPYIALSYMPPAIATGDIVSPPQRWEDWQLLVQKTIEHISGTRRTPNVHYEVWNEPDLFGGWKYYGERNYLTMYTYSAQGAARAEASGVQPFKLGGPGITALYKNWFYALAKHAAANNLRYDFFSWHRYDHDVDQFRKDMIEVRTWIKDFPALEPTLEMHITEWGHDSENHSGYDTNYGAAHTAAAAMEMVGVVDQAFVFEIQDGKDPNGQALWGRWGLLQHQDFGSRAKPRYHALKLIDQLGAERLQLLGKGSWVKGLAAREVGPAAQRPNGTVVAQVALSNFDQFGRHSEIVPITFQNIEPGQFTVDITYLNGRKNQVQVATDAATLRTEVSMPANDVALVELLQN